LLWTLSPSTSGQLTLSISGYYELAVTVNNIRYYKVGSIFIREEHYDT